MARRSSPSRRASAASSGSTAAVAPPAGPRPRRSTPPCSGSSAGCCRCPRCSRCDGRPRRRDARPAGHLAAARDQVRPPAADAGRRTAGVRRAGRSASSWAAWPDADAAPGAPSSTATCGGAVPGRGPAVVGGRQLAGTALERWAAEDQEPAAGAGRPRAGRASTASTRTCLVHSDANPKNLLVDPAGPSPSPDCWTGSSRMPASPAPTSATCCASSGTRCSPVRCSTATGSGSWTPGTRRTPCSGSPVRPTSRRWSTSRDGAGEPGDGERPRAAARDGEDR